MQKILMHKRLSHMIKLQTFKGPDDISRVRLNGSWFMIHSKVLNFHDWISCYPEPFL